MSNPQHEPTMEEILASIRKIISEDTPEAAAPAPAAAAPAAAAPVAAAPAPAPEPDDVLELTQEVAPEPEPARPAPAPEPPPAPVPENDVVFATVEPAAPAPEPAPSSDGIFSDRTRKAMEDTFAGIPAIPQPAAPPRAAPADVFGPAHGPTLESVFEKAVSESFEPVLRKYLADNASGIIEGMKPVIREWMDEHFPALLEGAVRAEAERVARSHIKR